MLMIMKIIQKKTGKLTDDHGAVLIIRLNKFSNISSIVNSDIDHLNKSNYLRLG